MRAHVATAALALAAALVASAAHWTGLDAFFAAGTGSQLIYVVPKLGFVVAIASNSNIPGGSVHFVDNVVLSGINNTSAPSTCIAQLGAQPLH